MFPLTDSQSENTKKKPKTKTALHNIYKELWKTDPD